MKKYPINKEFFPFSIFANPINDPKLAGYLGSKMTVPGWLFHDDAITVTRNEILGWNDRSAFHHP